MIYRQLIAYVPLFGIGFPVVRMSLFIPCPLSWSYYFCWSVMCLLNHGCLGLFEYLIVFSGAVLSNAFSSSVLSWLHASSRESLLSIVGGMKLVSKASAIILDLSLIVFYIWGNLSLCRWRSIETIQWSNIYPCVVVLATLTSPCSWVRMRSSVFSNLCICHCTCCSNPKATIVSLNMLFFALVVSAVWILKSPSIIRFV